MRLIPYDAERLKWHKPGSNQALIQEFLESGQKCVKVENFTQKNVKTAQANISTSVKSMGAYNVKVVVRKGELFLLRIDM